MYVCTYTYPLMGGYVYVTNKEIEKYKKEDIFIFWNRKRKRLIKMPIPTPQPPIGGWNHPFKVEIHQKPHFPHTLDHED